MFLAPFADAIRAFWNPQLHYLKGYFEAINTVVLNQRVCLFLVKKIGLTYVQVISQYLGYFLT